MRVNRARVVDTAVPAHPTGLVLVLHGGGARPGVARVSPAQLSVLRMVPVAARVARAGRDRLVVQRLLNSSRGWDAGHTPVDDVRWALDRAEERFGELPVCLVGHSLGGRAAILAAEHPSVRSVVALATWVYPQEGRLDLAGRRVLLVHGDADRVASPAASAAVARDLARTADVAYVTVTGGKHAMLGRHSVFDGLAAEWASATLPGRPPDITDGPTDDEGPGIVARALAGERWITV
ncbi:alpha/beta fold hydrolase [Terracoccus luteus]|uniref:Pimeloyl-ACP methyl ester carboxylesterase n=1 Tax=Terracoccus luteus TaxID=53356 RepID=A0A839PPB9_9MICO|nr:alpha/beta fold hydrolase [Terracoccus luteus]MBB2986050.1 pimeloyl-ACP methyl ester carboxylesterase [Terracoccus luteus]MCP2171702.1 pimeloyl-ACP methyl ester carboxylesterase [Terracoccus luteus]